MRKKDGEDGRATLDAKPVLPLENLPLYSKNETVRELAASGSPAYEEDLAKGCVDMASLLSKVRRPEEAKGLLQEALAIYRRLAAASPEAYEPALAQAAFFMGRLLKEMDRPEEGEQTLLRALEVCRLLMEEDPEQYRPYPAAVYLTLGIFWRERKPEKAEDALQKALPLYEILAEEAPAFYLKEKARVLFDLVRQATDKHCKTAPQNCPEGSFPRRGFCWKAG